MCLSTWLLTYSVIFNNHTPAALAVLGLPLAVFLVIASQPGINQVLYAGGHNPLQVLHSHLAANTELLAALGIGGIYLLLPESRKT